MNSTLMRNSLMRGLPIKILFLIIVSFVLLSSIFYAQLGPNNLKDKEEHSFVIPSGTVPGQIAADLEKQGFIKNARAFLIYARLVGKIDQFKAGYYLLSPSMNVPEITQILVKGKVATISFTIPEGYHLRQIVEVLVKKGIMTEEEFWTIIKEGKFSYPFLKDLPPTERRLEGYLFPDTYIIPLGLKPNKVIDVMLKRFQGVYESLPQNQTDLNIHEVVTLASIVEGESRVDEERPLIASVFLNRLEIGMKLDSDATIQYLFDKRKERVLYKDLEINSPYNTYRNKGLPPGPIGSPGEASLHAVLEPANSKYLYFVAKKDGSGEHVFARTLEEHGQNKRKLGY